MREDRTIDLACYIYPDWRPRIRVAPQRRGWMRATPESSAYRCPPPNTDTAHGWEVLSPCGFEAEWNGGAAVDDVVVRPDPGARIEEAPVALFGQGVLTFPVSGLFRTSPGYHLWAGGPPDAPKDGIAPLAGVIETDGSADSFIMNWRFTRAGQVRFEENEPFCFFFPVERALVDQVKPRIAPIEADPDLKRRFETWSAARDSSRAQVEAPADNWRTFHHRGVDADEAPGPQDHRARLRPAEFEGAEAFHRAATARPACPAARAPRVGSDTASAAKLTWLLSSLERLRAIAPDRAIPRMTQVSADVFRDAHYAANWPVLLSGAVVDWPAVDRWTPSYLRAAVGAQPVQVQVGRETDPDFDRNMADHAAILSFDAFIDRIVRPDADNDTCLTAYDSVANTEALSVLHADLGFLGALLSRECEHPHGRMWIGPRGSFTPLHHDLTNNLLLQIAGRKVILMAAPGETPKLYNDHHVYSRVRDLTEPDILTRFPKLSGIRIHRVLMGPGDALFIPLGWWHQVTSLDFSVTISHTNFRWPNDFDAGHPAPGA